MILETGGPPISSKAATSISFVVPKKQSETNFLSGYFLYLVKKIQKMKNYLSFIQNTNGERSKKFLLICLQFCMKPVVIALTF